MGSPIKFRSPSIFSRKHKKNHSASSISRTTSTTSSISIKEGKIFDYIKAATTKKSAKKSGSDKNNTSDDNKSTNSTESPDDHTVKDFDIVDSSNGLDSKGKEYVVECLGFGDIGEPQPVEHQYRFVKTQIKKIKERVLGQKVTTTKL